MYNSINSFNTILKACVVNVATKLSIQKIAVFLEEDRILFYPSVRAVYLVMGGWNPATQEFFHSIQLDVFTNNNDSETCRRIAHELTNELGLKQGVTMMWSRLDYGDFEQSLTNPPVTGKMRLALADQVGWRRVPDSDQEVRHYAVILTLYFKRSRIRSGTAPLYPPNP